MPARRDLKSIMVLGSGPIVIGQACEFDYSGTQALKALRAEGYRTILLNSNPATIMTDPALADRTYVEPLTVETLDAILTREKPDAILSTVGGQTGLNLAVEADEHGVLERHGVELLGAGARSVQLAEDRELFKETMAGIGQRTPRSRLVRTLEQGHAALEELGFPTILRASFTLGGAGSGIAHTPEEYESLLREGLSLSPVTSVLVEESVLGWKEYELEVIRDHAGNGIIVCSIENVDAMGVHTGDSITVAPAQTLTDREFQHLRDDALAVLDAVGVTTGGSNVQFAVHPVTGDRVVIEMNPRVSRSSALASKATGYPIAKIATLLAVGYTLDELPNEITGTSSACFEPSIDYTVVKIPRWSFEKFPGTSDTLGTTMRSVGEVMAMGRTFREALQKAMRALELDLDGWVPRKDARKVDTQTLLEHLERPTPDRMHQLHTALRRGVEPSELHRVTGIDTWFLDNLAELSRVEGWLRSVSLDELTHDVLLRAKQEGFSDARIARLLQSDTDDPVIADDIRALRAEMAVQPVFRRVDTCAAEFASETPYLYSTWEDGPCEARPTDRRKVIVLGSGPNRIGQGIEFDACCCHAVDALRAEGVEAIMVNCNPETVSTDYDTADRLYFEPLRFEEVMHIVELEKPEGVILTLGGQTPLKLADRLQHNGVPLLGTPVEAIDRAEDRDRFGELCTKLGVMTPDHGSARSIEEARRFAADIGYPVMVRPSYVLGGRGMRAVDDEAGMLQYFEEAARVEPEHPVLIDRFLEDAVEFDVDAVCDGRRVVIGGIMQHIEEAGVHSGDSFAVLPPYRCTPLDLDTMRDTAESLALELGVVGLINVQFAIHRGQLYVLEVNPRASRTVPFLEKATGVPLAEIATRCMIGQSLDDQGIGEAPPLTEVFVKGPVFPFRRFPDSDRLLGPEMKSTGEVMGIGSTFGEAFAKAEQASGIPLPSGGRAFLSVNDRDKQPLLPIARDLVRQGFSLLATEGTQRFLTDHGLEAEWIAKVGEAQPDIADAIHDGRVQLVINTTLGARSRFDEVAIRRSATLSDVPCITTLSGARAAVDGIRWMRSTEPGLSALQDLHGRATDPGTGS